MQQVIRPLFFQGIGHFRLAEHGIPGDHFAGHRHEAQQLQRGLVLVRFGVDTNLTHHRLDRRREQGEQVNRGDVALVGASQGLAIEGEVIAQIGAALQDPIAEDGFQSVGIESAEEAGVGGGGGCLPPAEAEHESEGLAVIAAELGDPLEGGAAGEHGDHRQTEHGAEVVDLALALARVVNAVEHLSQRAGHGKTSRGGLHLPYPPILANLNPEIALPPSRRSPSRGEAFPPPPGIICP